ncbi:MAG: alpha/beta hydrolase [Chloroflexi bacterium]|nr:alpha/beta hydrolase [Chloroflexota bacterium]
MLETRVGAGGVDLEVLRRGPESAPSVLFLHDLDYLNAVDYPFLAGVARAWQVVAPSHPGFGHSSLPATFDAVDDLAYTYLDVLRHSGPAHVVGAGFGGWIAAEMAIRCTHDLRSLVLVDALGIKVGDRTTTDIHDMFVVSPDELLGMCWHDASLGARLMPLPDARFDEDTLSVLLSNRRTAALVGWNPFMHSPKLLGRLARIDCPTLVVWGDSDGLVSPAYGRAYAEAIPGARFELIREAGHYPYLEQPERFLAVLEPFLHQPTPSPSGRGRG